MQKIVFLRGIVASGKSTRRNHYLREGFYCVSRDDVRQSLRGSHYQFTNKDDEDLVTIVTQTTFNSLFLAGKNIVVDATNLKVKSIKSFIDYVLHNTTSSEVEFILDEIDTPLPICQDRNSLRPKTAINKVPDFVLDRMYTDFILYKNEIKQYIQDSNIMLKVYAAKK
jgi:predicted kinase